MNKLLNNSNFKPIEKVDTQYFHYFIGFLYLKNYDNNNKLV